MILLEGAANGLPLLAFDVPTGPSEIINNGVNGFLCQNDKEEDMVRAILYLTTNEKLRVAISVESKNTALQFEVSQIAQRWIALFEELIR